MNEFLPENIRSAVNALGINNIYEIRLRKDKPVYVNFKNNYIKLLSGGREITTGEELLEKIVLSVCDFSVYRSDEHIKQGFITSNEGERIGICGEYVYDCGKLVTIKNFTSLNIRIPHEIRGSAENIYNKLFSGNIPNVLIVSEPGRGKTTVLRDLTRLISERKKLNVLCVDERNEISAGGKFDLGETTDVMTYAEKKTGFTEGVRNLKPDVLITDELMNENDVSGIILAALSGVKVVATAHSDSTDKLKKKEMFQKIFSNGIFDYSVTLGKDFNQEIIKL